MIDQKEPWSKASLNMLANQQLNPLIKIRELIVENDVDAILLTSKQNRY